VGQQEPGGLPELQTEAGHVEEQDSLFDANAQARARGHARAWGEGELRIFGERIRDHLRQVGRRAVAAFVHGGIARGDAELYVAEDMHDIAGEIWAAPKATTRPRTATDRGRGGAREDTRGA
jgi:hypothetical protein